MEKNVLFAIDGFKLFKEWKAFKEQGLELDIENFIAKLCKALSENSNVHYISPFGFRCAFIGLPEKVTSELRDFLDYLQRAGIMVSTAPLLRGKEKEIDSRLQEWIKNFAKYVAKIVLLSGDGDFARIVKEIKNNCNTETICVYSDIPEKDIHFSQNLKEACSDHIDLCELTEDREIFKKSQLPVQSEASLMSKLLQQNKSSTAVQTESLMDKFKKTASLSAVQPKTNYYLSVTEVCDAMNATKAYKEERCKKKLSWISLGSLQRSLEITGTQVDLDGLEEFLLKHQDIFFVSSYTTINGETFKTVSLLPETEPSTHEFKPRLQQLKLAV